MITKIVAFALTGLAGSAILKSTGENSDVKSEKGFYIESQITISATSDKVWELLTDFKKYPDWNPFIKSIEGEPEKGEKLKVLIQPPGDSPMKFTPRVLVFDKGKEFRWLGHLLFPGLFDGEHIFRIIDNQDGTLTFIHKEKFKGILVPLFKKKLLNNTKTGFQQMNEKLKELAEKEHKCRNQ